jgi:TatD DNase family protein
MVDTHAHLALCEPDEDELIADAREAGVRRILTVGLGEDSNPEAVRAAEEDEGVFAAVGRHPNSAGGFDAAAANAIEELAARPGVVAIGETGLDFYRDRSEPEDQRRAFSAQISIARNAGKPVVIHLRDKDRSEDAVSEAFDTLDREGDGVSVILHCFSAGAAWAERGRREGLVLLVRGQPDLPERRAASPGGRAYPGGPPAGGDRLAVPRATADARHAEPARERGRDGRAARGGPRRLVR